MCLLFLHLAFPVPHLSGSSTLPNLWLSSRIRVVQKGSPNATCVRRMQRVFVEYMLGIRRMQSGLKWVRRTHVGFVVNGFNPNPNLYKKGGPVKWGAWQGE